MECIRVKDDVVSTPIMQYVGKHRRVDLIGMFHIAEGGYFRFVQRQLDRRADYRWKILYENYALGDNNALSQDDPVLRPLRQFGEAVARFLSLPMARWNLAYQPNILRTQHHWICSDMSLSPMLEVFRRAFESDPQIPEFLLQCGQVIAETSDDEIVEMSATLLRAGHFRIEEANYPSIKSFFDAILDARSDYALSVLREQDEHADCAMVWGAGHLPRFAEFLESQGMRLSLVEWIPAFKIPSS